MSTVYASGCPPTHLNASFIHEQQLLSVWPAFMFCSRLMQIRHTPHPLLQMVQQLSPLEACPGMYQHHWWLLNSFRLLSTCLMSGLNTACVTPDRGLLVLPCCSWHATKKQPSLCPDSAGCITSTMAVLAARYCATLTYHVVLGTASHGQLARSCCLLSKLTSCPGRYTFYWLSAAPKLQQSSSNHHVTESRLPSSTLCRPHPNRQERTSSCCWASEGSLCILHPPPPPPPPPSSMGQYAFTSWCVCRVRCQHVHSESASELPQPAACRLCACGGSAWHLHGQPAG